ncbi:MAG TPA: universal stress protein [Pyrinomonadaceae bacterium]|jgi:nucleotide-binding universal stress UspA family protein
MRLLLAVDSITTTELILKTIESRSWPAGTEARILSVVEDAEVPDEVWREAGYGVGAVQQEMKRRGEQIAALSVDRLQRIDIPTRVVVTRGDPGFLISYAAREWPADLILIRAHNRRDLRSRLLGSVAKSVLQSASCSVELVRANPEVNSDVALSGPGILLPIDNSDGSMVAAEHIARTSWPKSTRVNVISVVNPLVYSLEEIGLYTDRGTERAHQAINDAVHSLSDTGLEISAAVVAGRTTKEILKQAKLWKADLIVVGSNKRRGLKRMISRSVSEAVASRAHCSVRIVGSDSRPANKLAGKWPFTPSITYELSRDVGLRKAA